MSGDSRSRGRPSAGARGRGQVITLEAITGAILLLLMVLFALQSTVITPLSASTANQQIEEQNRVIAADALDTAAARDAITPVILNWNESANQFNGTENTAGTYYTQGVPADEFDFGQLLNKSLTRKDIAYNMYVQYREGGNQTETTVVFQGDPSYNAATATKTVFLHNRTVERSGPDRYIPDISPGSQLDNTVRVKLVVWRM